MSESFTLGSGYIVAEMALHSNGVYAANGGEMPTLIATLQMTFKCPEQAAACLDFKEIRCKVSPFDQTYVASSVPVDPRVRITSGKVLNNHLVYLPIPLDRTRLAHINRLRDGKDVTLRLDFELDVDELAEIGRTQNRMKPSVWGLVDRHLAYAKLSVTISRSQWVEQILPGTQFGKTHIIELPTIPIEGCAGVKAAFDALQQAQKLESQGFYDEAAAKCRIALEPFCEQVDKIVEKGAVKKVPKLKASWETRLGKATYEWLNASFAAIRQAANQSHHLSSTPFGQLEAQMLLMITTALIAYAVKTDPQSPPP